MPGRVEPPSQNSGPVSRTRGRPRRVETDVRIHAAALRLLHDGGPRAVTVDAVAAASAVAKTTIYRRYADRGALLRAALADTLGEPEEAPDTDPRDRLRWAVDQLWHQMADVLGPGGLAAVVGNTDHQFTELCRELLAPYTGALVTVIQAEVASGVLRHDLDVDAVVSLSVGGYLGELVRRGSVDAPFRRACLDLMWAAMTPATGPTTPRDSRPPEEP